MLLKGIGNFIFLLLAAFSVWGMESDVALNGAQACPKEKILLSHLKGIVITSNESTLSKKDLEQAQGIQIRDLCLPGPAQCLVEKLSPFLSCDITSSQIDQMKKTIGTFYAENDHPLVSIQVPPQEVTHGVLRFVVTESRLGKISVEGNQKWSHLDRIKNSFGLEPGDWIDTRYFTRDLNFINRSYFRHATALFEPGQNEDTTDVIILVEDTFPLRVYAGIDNTGIVSTGRTLTYAGFSWGNAFGLEHTLSYQYTTSTFKMFHGLQAHSVQYLAPLSWKHELNVFGGYASINPKPIPFVSSSHGFFGQGSFRYAIPLLPIEFLRHEFVFGGDYKRTNSALFFTSDVGFTSFNQPVNLTQIVVGYNGTYLQEDHGLDYYAELYWSPGEWLTDQTNADYNALRTGAKNKWVYGHAQMIYHYRLPKSFVLKLRAEGQLSSAALLPSEQFGLGGFYTVRSYDERLVNQDSAVLFSAELYSPSIQLINLKKREISDSLSFLVFFDYSYGKNRVPIPGEKNPEHLMGAGPGARYSFGNYLFARLDWGIKLHKDSDIGENFSLIHFAVVGSY